MGRLIIGVLSDEAEISYKRYPLLPYAERKALFEYTENYHKQNVDYITLSTATKNNKSILYFYIEKMDMSFWSAKLFKKI